MTKGYTLVKNPEDMNWNAIAEHVKVKFFADEKKTYKLKGTDGKFFLVLEKDGSVTKANQIYVKA